MPLDRDTLPSTSSFEASGSRFAHMHDSPVKKRCILRGSHPLRGRTVLQATGDRLVITRTIQRQAKSGFPFYAGATTGEVTHTTILDTAGIADYSSVIGYFAQTIMKDFRLVSGYDVLYGKVKAFVQTELFDRPAELEDANTLRNLSELAATKTLIETFKAAINALTVQDKGDAQIRDTIKLRNTRPFVAKDQGYLIPTKSVFNRIIGDSPLELLFARFLDDCDDVVSYAKNYFAVNFKLDYVKADGDISNYYPDFLVKLSAKEIFIVETKGQEDLEVSLKMKRLRQWCEDINRTQGSVKYDFVYVDQESFEKYKPKSFRQLIAGFKEFK
jgi:type III restriction enzyme